MEVFVRIDSTVPLCVEGDFHRLEHVLANLLSNSIKFSPPNTKLHVMVDVISAEQKRWLRMTVRDQGIGISLEDQDRIFSPYVQIQPLKTQAGKGTGLGLSICKGIIRAHSGHLGCRSRETAGPELTEGSEFFFEIPLVELDFQQCKILESEETMKTSRDTVAKGNYNYRALEALVRKKEQVNTNPTSPVDTIGKAKDKSNDNNDNVDVLPESEMTPSSKRKLSIGSTTTDSPSLSSVQSHSPPVPAINRSSFFKNVSGSIPTLMAPIHVLICDGNSPFFCRFFII
jgi:hypothetical protein